MKLYSVSIPWYSAVVVEVCANDENEAKELALKRTSPSLCHQCACKGIELGDANLDVEPDVQEVCN